MTRWMLLLCVATLGCGGGGGGGKPAGSTVPSERTASADTRSEIQVRRDAACEALGPRVTACAIADARATMSAAELAELDLEKTASRHTEEFVKDCKSKDLSSRQVRVYEVCLAQETECDPLMTCLDNANPSGTTP